MSHDQGTHRSRGTSEPKLFDVVPKNVWREVYRGRWNELRPVQKAEFVVEIVFSTLFVASFVYDAYIRDGHWLGLVLSFGVVWLILALFFYLLTRFIR